VLLRRRRRRRQGSRQRRHGKDAAKRTVRRDREVHGGSRREVPQRLAAMIAGASNPPHRLPSLDRTRASAHVGDVVSLPNRGPYDRLPSP
jgi:hypothetical protein